MNRPQATNKCAGCGGSRRLETRLGSCRSQMAARFADGQLALVRNRKRQEAPSRSGFVAAARDGFARSMAVPLSQQPLNKWLPKKSWSPSFMHNRTHLVARKPASVARGTTKAGPPVRVVVAIPCACVAPR